MVIDNAGNRTASQKITEVTNTAPVVASMTCKTKSTSSITITANATDVDAGDKLTYVLYVGTSETNLDKVSTPVTDATPGQNVDLIVSGLSQYTTYYYKVVVTDLQNASDEMASSEQSANKTIRTFCPGTGSTCTGPFTQPCPNCGGAGDTGYHDTECPKCGGSGDGGNGKLCTRCGGNGFLRDYYDCKKCNGSRNCIFYLFTWV